MLQVVKFVYIYLIFNVNTFFFYLHVEFILPPATFQLLWFGFLELHWQ